VEAAGIKQAVLVASFGLTNGFEDRKISMISLLASFGAFRRLGEAFATILPLS
jgi:hypothetical protein